MRVTRLAAAAIASSLLLMVEATAATCPDDSVPSGTVCIDKYEASVWHVPPEHVGLIRKLREGQAALRDLLAAGAVQLGLAPGDLAAVGCPATGSGCLNIYAASIADVTPSRYLTWFQALAFARNSLKRLPTNQEWQAAALGTPDGEPCNVGIGVWQLTGGQPGCVSDVGAFDMVGGVGERVGEWAEQGNFGFNCINWPAEFGGDRYCIGGVGSSDATRLPGVPVRGGSFGYEAEGGVFAAVALGADVAANTVGFRCVREMK